LGTAELQGNFSVGGRISNALDLFLAATQAFTHRNPRWTPMEHSLGRLVVSLGRLAGQAAAAFHKIAREQRNSVSRTLALPDSSAVTEPRERDAEHLFDTCVHSLDIAVQTFCI